jgi:glycine cleavage system transcriptional repressor
MHQHYVISVVSRDRIGIVADVSSALAALGGDIADLRQSVLSDYFTMILLASFPEEVSVDAIQQRIAQGSDSSTASLHITVLPVDASAGEQSPTTSETLSSIVHRPSSISHNYLLTARGPDRVGFVASVSAFCARNGLNILDLATTVADGRYVMMLLVDVSRCTDLDAVRRQLREFGQANGLKAVLQHEAIFRATNEVDQ